MGVTVDGLPTLRRGAMPNEKELPPSVAGLSATALTLLTALVFVVVASVHFYTVVTRAVNVPVNDEWTVLNPDALPAGISWRWISAFSNEHRIVPTRLLTAAFFKWTRWNLRYQQIANFGIFGMVLAALMYIRSLAASGVRIWAFLAFLLFLLSPIAGENHSWAMQSCFHFVLLFTVLSATLLFHPRRGAVHFVLGLLFLAAACFSLATGVPAAFAIVLTLTYVELKRKGWIALGVLYLWFAAVLAIWFRGYVKPSYHPDVVTPLTARFWVFLLNLVGLGFGFTDVSVVSGGLAFAVIVIPMAWLLLRAGRGALPASAWPVLATTIAVLAMLVGVAVGRAGFPVAQSKGSRYAEISFLLIPLAALLWSVCLRDSRKWRHGTLGALWCFLLLGYRDNWAFSAVYEPVRVERQAGLNCVIKYLEGEGPDECPMISSSPLAEKANMAKRLGLSFVDGVRPPIEPGFLEVKALPAGTLERATYGAGRLYVSGWAAAPVTVDPAKNLLGADARLTFLPWVSDGSPDPGVSPNVVGPSGRRDAWEWAFSQRGQNVAARLSAVSVKKREKIAVSIWLRAPLGAIKVSVVAARIGGRRFEGTTTEFLLGAGWRRCVAVLDPSEPEGIASMLLVFSDGPLTVEACEPHIETIARSEQAMREPPDVRVYVDRRLVGRVRPGGRRPDVVRDTGDGSLLESGWVFDREVPLREGKHEAFATFSDESGAIVITNSREFLVK